MAESQSQRNKVLMVGLDPAEIDLERWPHMTDKELKAAMHGEAEKLRNEGYEPTICFVDPKTAEKTIEGMLSTVNFDCILIGAGVRADPTEVCGPYACPASRQQHSLT